MAHQKDGYLRKQREHTHDLLDSTIWNDFRFRDDDIVISAHSKSGTTWIQQIVAQLLWNGAEHIKLSEVSPWLDCRFPSREKRMAIVESQSHRRFIKSHLPVDTLVFSHKAKYIYIARDGRDVVWSLYNHHRKFKKEFIRGTDEVSDHVGPPLGEAPPSVVQYFREWLEKDGYPWWPYWEHIHSWWNIRDLPNVMLMHFSNLKKDLPTKIRRVAEFLDVTIDGTKWDRILEHSSFDYMKAHAAEVVPFGGIIWEGGAEAFMHKGTNGRWEDMLTREDIEQYERMAREKLGIECANWLSTGELPEI